MKQFIASSIFFLSVAAWGSTDLREMMGSTCEALGPTAGAQCIELQRRLESENVVLDLNGSTACSLIWQWGSHSDNLYVVKNKVLACFRQVANMKVNDEVRDTCEGPLTNELEGFASSSQKVMIKADKMLGCIKQLATPVLASRR